MRAPEPERLQRVRALLLDFAARTGLTDATTAPVRYLWTDAHAVCTFLSLHRQGDDPESLNLAIHLIGQVHDVLGRYRCDDPRTGWISGLDEDEGRAHPTAGGLRIGKPLPERPLDAPIDERLEWERDGQYFHYLTKWMHALCRASAVTGDDSYTRWASELAQAAFSGFRSTGRGEHRLYWKMSTDLSRPLVASSGQHDPLDGYATFVEISRASSSDLNAELAGFRRMLEHTSPATVDPLGIGGLLFDACRLTNLSVAGAADDVPLAEQLIAISLRCLRVFADSPETHLPAERRLAFRELGLAIGLHAAEEMAEVVGAGETSRFGTRLCKDLDALQHFVPLARQLEDFWSEPGSQSVATWREHADINAVTLATSLLPDQFLDVGGN